MRMEELLKTAVQQLNSGLLNNEAQVKQAVVLPILRGLGWDDTNPAEFVPEFGLDEGRVDYALCQTAGSPLVFIEAKRLGSADTKGEEQLFGYASNKGVPLLILTDGNIWDFYLSMAAGVPAERKFYHAELLREEKISEYVGFLEKHLEKNRVISGEAKRAAEQLHNDNQQKKKAERAIPKVWRSLLETPDDILIALLTEAVEGECGTRPALAEVKKFLKGKLSDTQVQPLSPPLPSVRLAQKSERSGSKIIGFVLDKQPRRIGYARNTLAEILKEFQHRDDSFMAQFDSATGVGKPLVSQNTTLLIADTFHPAIELKSGWFLGTKNSTKSIEGIRKIIELACKVAGVRFGTQLTLIER